MYKETSTYLKVNNELMVNNDVFCLEAQDGGYHYYAKTIDPPDIQLLCTSTDPTIPLDDIQWDNSPPFNQNPIILNKILSFDSTMTCNIGATQMLQVNLRVQGMQLYILSIQFSINVIKQIVICDYNCIFF